MGEKRRDRRKDDRDRVSKFSRFHLWCQGSANERRRSFLLVRLRGRRCASVAANSDAPSKKCSLNLNANLDSSTKKISPRITQIHANNKNILSLFASICAIRGHDPSVQRNFPGFKMSFGSRICFSRRCRLRATSLVASGHQRFLARPIPCSPVITPPQARTWAKRSSSARSTFSRTAASRL